MPGYNRSFAEIRATLAAQGILQNKDTDAHWTNYERSFPWLRERVKSILEIGILHGASLAAMSAYFPGARVHGLDWSDFLTPEVKSYIAEQGGRVTADTAAPVPDEPTQEFQGRVDAMGVFDLIIDDAAHTYATARTAFNALFSDHLSAGGLYIIEDWGTTYWPEWSDGSEDGRRGMLNLVTDFCDMLAKPGLRENCQIEKVEIYHWQLWVWKKP